MASVYSDTTSQTVAKQYENYPYPLRNPADEHKRLMISHVDNLNALNHYGFRGRRDFSQGFRVLVAGGGTGDATTCLACQLAKTDARIVHLDLSSKAIDISRQRVRAWGLEHRVEWIQDSLLKLPELNLGKFDYVNCSGVLHHLAQPEEGLAALDSVLADDGVMAIMVYGQYGRTGVYQTQDLMRLLAPPEQPSAERVEATRNVLSALPPTNWMRAGSPHLYEKADNHEIYDMFLHSQDRAYTVGELYEFLDSAGLNLIEFDPHHRLHYDYRYAGPLATLAANLPKRQQQAAAELFWGAIHKHAFWASHKTDTIADPNDPDNIPTFVGPALMLKTREHFIHARGKYFSHAMNMPGGLSLEMKIPVTPSRARIAELINGTRTTGAIAWQVASEEGITEAQAIQEIVALVEVFSRQDLLLLRHRSVWAPPNLEGCVAPVPSPKGRQHFRPTS